jgi:structural maintenance of chromosome 1
MGRLVQIELENFKSYMGHQVIGPFSDFTAVIGPNGAGKRCAAQKHLNHRNTLIALHTGKSNLMEAISFVLGLKSQHLRSAHLRQLIFRSDANAAPARRAWVQLVYEVDAEEVDGKKVRVCSSNSSTDSLSGEQEGDRVLFMRAVSGAGASSYKIDGKDVCNGFKCFTSQRASTGVMEGV